MNLHDSEMSDIAASGASFAAYLNDDEAADESAREAGSGLRKMYVEYKQTLQATPVRTDQVDHTAGFDFMPGDIDGELKSALFEQVLELRKKRVTFSALPDYNAPKLFASGGPMSGILQRSRFCKATGEAGKKNSLMIFSAELFPNKFGFYEGIKNIGVFFQIQQLTQAQCLIMKTITK